MKWAVEEDEALSVHRVQLMPKSKGGPERGISLAARSLPIPGKTEAAPKQGELAELFARYG